MRRIPSARAVRLWVLHSSMNGLRSLLADTSRQYHALRAECTRDEILVYEQILKEEGEVRR